MTRPHINTEIANNHQWPPQETKPQLLYQSAPNDQDLINNLQASLIFAPASNLAPIGES